MRRRPYTYMTITLLMGSLIHAAKATATEMDMNICILWSFDRLIELISSWLACIVGQQLKQASGGTFNLAVEIDGWSGYEGRLSESMVVELYCTYDDTIWQMT